MDAASRPIGARELIGEIANSFEQQGWSDDQNLALAIARDAGESGTLDPGRAAALAKPLFLTRNQIDGEALERVLTPIFAGRTPIDPRLDPPPAEPAPQSVTTYNTLEVSGDGNAFSGSVNVGGSQVILTQASPKEDVLGAVRALLTDALTSELSEPNLRALAELIESRDDLPEAELQRTATEAISAADPPPGKLVALREKLAASVTSGVLVHTLILAIEAIPFP